MHVEDLTSQFGILSSVVEIGFSVCVLGCWVCVRERETESEREIYKP